MHLRSVSNVRGCLAFLSFLVEQVDSPDRSFAGWAVETGMFDYDYSAAFFMFHLITSVLPAGIHQTIILRTTATIMVGSRYI